MRRTTPLLRGAKGYNWYETFMQKGQDGFKKFTPPTPFDWTQSTAPRPKIYFSMKIDREVVGKLVFELADDVVPKTVENFKRLVQGKGEKFKGYKGTPFHILRKGEIAMGGDIENKDGTGNHSSYLDRYIKDENFIIPHSQRGLIR